VARWTSRPIRVAPGSLKVDRDLEWSPSLEFLRNLIERTGNRNESERFTGRLRRQVIPFPIPPPLVSRIQRRRGIKGGYLGLSFALSYFACCSCFALLAACSGLGPCGHLHLDWRVDFPAIRYSDLLQVSATEIHI
jgi:hypothetical protein